jgi:hypothetical protein
MRSTRTCIVGLLTALGSIACGSSGPPPNDQWAAAQASVGRAQAGGAPNVPDANLHLQLASEDLQKCKQMINVDNGRAQAVCLLASSEAELALSLARQADAQREALQAQTELQKAGGTR